MFDEKRKELINAARDIRLLTSQTIGNLGFGHMGGCLSIADLLAVLYFKEMNVNPSNPKTEGRDRLVCSKGHAGPAVYATLALKGYFEKSMLQTLNQLGTDLPSHCDMNHTPGIDMSTGSLGQGLSCAVGMALGSKLKADNAYIYCIIGDGESQEGQIWEALMTAGHYKLDNLIVFLDKNRLEICGTTDEVCTLEPIQDKMKAFGFFTQEIDGHDVEVIDLAIKAAKARKNMPSAIILDTVKGKGISFVEGKREKCHSMPFTMEDFERAKPELLRGGCDDA